MQSDYGNIIINNHGEVRVNYSFNITHTCADYLPQFCRWITPDNVVFELICCWNVRVDVYFRYSIDDFRLSLDNFDLFRDARDGISM